MLRELRNGQLPIAQDGVLGGGDPPRCTDLRRFRRDCGHEVTDEAAFNSFLITNPGRKIHPPYLEMIQSRLCTDHRMVLTHGDLHPQNIMVKWTDSDGIEITGLVDWELSGVYPESWEFVKAMSGIRATSKNDWYSYLPFEAIGRYPDEYMLDIMIDGIQL